MSFLDTEIRTQTNLPVPPAGVQRRYENIWRQLQSQPALKEAEADRLHDEFVAIDGKYDFPPALLRKLRHKT